ncbi:unnamed protein product, partial [Staurois parvus]
DRSGLHFYSSAINGQPGPTLHPFLWGPLISLSTVSSMRKISRTQGTNTPPGLCGTPDVQEDSTLVRNISLTQDRKVDSSPCEISDVCKDLTCLKNTSHTQDRSKAFPLCETSGV